MVYYLIRFWIISFGNFDFGKFSLKISDVIFSRSNTILAISGMVDPIDVKQKGSELVGYWVWCVILIFDLTGDLDFGCFKVKFRNSCIFGIVGLIDVKWKRSKSIGYWADCMTLPFDHIWSWSWSLKFKESEIALSQEWDGWLTWKEKNVSHPFMTMVLTRVTMVGWADVPDSDRGDFRHRHAADITTF